MLVMQAVLARTLSHIKLYNWRRIKGNLPQALYRMSIQKRILLVTWYNIFGRTVYNVKRHSCKYTFCLYLNIRYVPKRDEFLKGESYRRLSPEKNIHRFRT